MKQKKWHVLCKMRGMYLYIRSMYIYTYTYNPTQAFQEARAPSSQTRSPPPGMCIVTPAHPSGESPWTMRTPLPVTLVRIASLARATLRAAHRLLTTPPTVTPTPPTPQQPPSSPLSPHHHNPSTSSWLALFQPSFKGYDVVLTFDHDAVNVTAAMWGAGLRNKAAVVALERALKQQHKAVPVLEDAGVVGTVYVTHPDSCRAVVRRIPASTVATKGCATLVSELLVGFCSVAALVETLERQLGGAVLFFWDPLAPRVLCMKFKGSAVKPHVLDPENAHWVKPVVVKEEAGEDGQARKKKKMRKHGWDGMVVLDPVRVVAQVVDAGAGMITAVL